MKNFICLIVASFSSALLFGQEDNQNFITSDIEHFWTAYDQITTTKDSVQQYAYLNKTFLEKGSPGLKAIMEARQYSAKSYIDAINSYPLFWNSIRQNTLKAKGFSKDIALGISKVKKLYPDLKPAKIYFTIGAFRTGGTTLNDMVLIGSEIALADETVVTTEFPASFSNLAPYFKSNPINNVVFGNIHEYIHTQQKTTIANNLLGQCVMEGVAEFVAVTATGETSLAPAMYYGKANAKKVRDTFAMQMFNTSTGYWLYSNAENDFNVRDLGYYTGYTICEKYYAKALDKTKAIKKMIELDYNNDVELAAFVDQSGYFVQAINQIKSHWQHNRPTVKEIKPFNNDGLKVNPKLTAITISFSTRMDPRYRSFEIGNLGESHLLRLKNTSGFSNDGKSITFEIELKANERYQLIIGEGFRSRKGIALQPYLIDFSTASREK